MAKRLLKSIVMSAWLAVAPLCGFLAPPALADGGPENVLVITSWDQHLPWSAEFVSALRALNRDAGAPLRLYFEHLDSGRFGNENASAFKEYLAAKYRDADVSRIVSESLPASIFLLAADDLLPRAGRVFVASGGGRSLVSGSTDRSLHIPIDNNYAASLGTALSTTGARTVHVVVDTEAPGGLNRLQDFMRDSAEHYPEVPVSVIEAPTFDAVLAQAAALPEDAVIYYLLVFSDGAGNRMTAIEAARSLSEAAAVPVFSNWEVLLGTGIVGGYMISAERVAQRLFPAMSTDENRQSDASDIYGHYFDWRALRRHGIAAAAVPEWAEVRFRELSILEMHFYEALAVAVALGVMAAMSLALMVLLARVRSARNLIEAERAVLEVRVAERTADLEKAVERAVDANTQKTAFLANMSHEIRTPLGGMLGLADLIVEEPGSAATAEHARRLKDAGRHLLSVVNDILDFTKLSAGKVVLEPAPFHLAGLAGAIESSFGPTVDRKGLRLATDCPPDAWIVADEFRLRQVLFNLVGNAVKATDRGEVLLRMELADDPGSDPTGATLSIQVTDTGSGMPKDMLTQIFEPYVQAGEAGIAGGTGLGLAICQELVQTMGGEISVDSARGEGSTFSFSIPVGRAEAQEAPVPAAHPRRQPVPSGTKVLFADDHEINRMLVEAALTKLGYEVTTVTDGQEALCAARLEPFDAIILDIQMPRMDGLQALAILKSEGLDRGRPIIALTADVVPENVAQYKAAGFDACLSKPFDWGVLDLAIRRSLTGNRSIAS